MAVSGRAWALALFTVGLLTACGGSDQSASSSGSGASSNAASTSAPATAAPKPILLANTVPSHGTLLVAALNGMTVYRFAKDVAGSGKSNCSGPCLARWPAVTVPPGTTPTAGPGVAGKMTAITRDDGALQCTYNGLPLYFFTGDKAPGDVNGNYTGWASVTP